MIRSAARSARLAFMSPTELIIQLAKVAIGLALGAHFVWWIRGSMITALLLAGALGAVVGWDDRQTTLSQSWDTVSVPFREGGGRRTAARHLAPNPPANQRAPRERYDFSPIRMMWIIIFY